MKKFEAPGRVAAHAKRGPTPSAGGEFTQISPITYKPYSAEGT